MLLSAPVLDDPAVLEAKQVERNRRSGITRDALVFGMQKDEIAVHERAVDRYVGGGRARYFGGKRFHPSKPISEVWIVLYERLGKIPIDCSGILPAKDIDHGFASVGAQSVRSYPRRRRRLGRCRLSQA